jgi:diaminohydroxyphosphoribosylaminopyrimidine deaminase/5-amino-6-(5-phosphoribosylamino)uracil reductase
VTRVVAAMQDPNPLVAGRGWRACAAGCWPSVACWPPRRGNQYRLRRAHDACRPWLRLKLAASLDGKTALQNGASQWLTGAAARQDGHRWRARACAILTGIGTVRHDDPQLNVRGVEATTGELRQPLKVVVDSRLELSPDARVLRDGGAWSPPP